MTTLHPTRLHLVADFVLAAMDEVEEEGGVFSMEVPDNPPPDSEIPTTSEIQEAMHYLYRLGILVKEDPTVGPNRGTDGSNQ